MSFCAFVSEKKREKKMSKPSSSKIIHGLLRLHHLRVNSTSTSKAPTFHSPSFSSASRSHFHSNGSPIFKPFPSNIHPKFHPIPTSSNLGLTQILTKQFKFSTGFRSFSIKRSEFGQKLNGNFAKKVIDKPMATVSSTFSRYREAVGLQIDAFFRRYYLVLLGAGGVMLCGLLWRIMYGVANAFVGISEGLAKYGFLALSSAIVAFIVSSN